MRYSMLVYLTGMSGTLLEAAEYLRTAKQGELREELLENGRQMIGQIRAELERHSGDLHSSVPLVRLAEIETLWAGCGEGLEAQLKRFRQDLPRQVSYQVRAVFFAELGEKWDAMESVYEYMRDDPRFDPVVVLTPVFRITDENGERRQDVIYRDYLTPLQIPFLPYDQYRIEEDCPELAFISQPYESCTLQQFWPETIAKYSRLVYLPYFLPSIVLKDYPSVLCQMPVYNAAWKVIGAGEKHHRYYQKHARHGGGNMLVTGVPKMDTIIRAREEGVPLPSGWKGIKGKKTFLWNSWFDVHLSSLRFFEEIFGWFQQHTDCALIWRPHPMTETVTKVYFPDRTAYLQRCKERIKAAPNTVLDEETAFLASFVYSNAQISDHSSMMQQYLPMNKPLLWFGIPAFGATGEEFICTDWMERGNTAQDILRFLERIRDGTDPNAQLRETILQRDMPLADGRSGQRVCEALWSELHTEDCLAGPYSEKGEVVPCESNVKR